jgi:hypothetical protein
MKMRQRCFKSTVLDCLSQFFIATGCQVKHLIIGIVGIRKDRPPDSLQENIFPVR